MTLSELQALARAGQIAELNLLSLEGGFYILDIHAYERRDRLQDDSGKTWHLRSPGHARYVLRDLPEVPFYLVQHSAYDEMVGAAPSSEAPLKTPLSLWQADKDTL
ncbi:hypothetical protein IQ22_02175 [Pseudomonas duriflava]|uniref:Cation transport ATPase n=1 Tax=Pseudomonas duriflava TaxID=459528 RepID=A0A562QC41_9PSED|nr:DUF6482 family protein [Pseudomonas duriflava]TWI54312.1 hypothetical protein IQ22_02175 [Pseudomonas duriflava]